MFVFVCRNPSYIRPAVWAPPNPSTPATIPENSTSMDFQHLICPMCTGFHWGSPNARLESIFWYRPWSYQHDQQIFISVAPSQCKSDKFVLIYSCIWSWFVPKWILWRWKHYAPPHVTWLAQRFDGQDIAGWLFPCDIVESHQCLVDLKLNLFSEAIWMMHARSSASFADARL